ncbi:MULTISPECIES: PLP-dependent aminotransferase family protein [unclassified Lysobacter]|uniref:MocR-like pyridoxine biosynthesis transcription factor PdxR n=1 Tax=unclassified Lysobacter TaxID=2635362 RepID=UPI001BE5A81B|nr:MULTISPECIES: PLP-dependent aminotransferase family protein [unclassified Lysobacter]MBT2748099.1 PLP-dependent aminotransferase family protein [Lysobacter sp. ISL-42]MBT2754139.1 PLP-dependent aminotransferase family protein [Lysobacter sp. ISL-50]MBT2776035.1 PLP-dependent aminotransferase family protein [Lysobacter sp. ISL-54]MBT2784126.1 PLP-dependent aminotransferase family protein [Lysobacter sp. ISL-52]
MEPVFQFPLALPDRGHGNLSQELHQQLRSAILDGRLIAGSALPATRQVASALGIARNTVVSAYDLLIAEGYVTPRPGAKAVVADVAARRDRRGPQRLDAGLEDPRLNPLWRTPFLRPDPPRQLPERCFRLGIPDHRHFPHDVWRRLSAQTLRTWSKTRFSYPPSEGIAELRDAIAQHVAFARAVACVADDVIVTSGAQQAFDLLARLLVTPGQTRVAVEEPGYPPVRAAFAAAGARLVPMPVDEEGLCVEQLPEDVRVISVTPSHQSPTGVALSMRRRRALLDFARQRNAIVIEDDYDGEFRFGGRPLDALQTLDRDALVFYVGTFSKSLFPSLRKGFIVAPAWSRDALITVKHCADSHCDTITQSVLAAFIRDGHLARHVRRMRAIYEERRDALLDGLRGPLAPWLEPIPSEAGLHLAARIRDPALAPAILSRLPRYAPGAQSIAEYAMSAPAQPAITFGYGVIDADEIRLALRRYAVSLAELDAR